MADEDVQRLGARVQQLEALAMRWTAGVSGGLVTLGFLMPLLSTVVTDGETVQSPNLFKYAMLALSGGLDNGDTDPVTVALGVSILGLALVAGIAVWSAFAAVADAGVGAVLRVTAILGLAECFVLWVLLVAVSSNAGSQIGPGLPLLTAGWSVIAIAAFSRTYRGLLGRKGPAEADRS